VARGGFNNSKNALQVINEAYLDGEAAPTESFTKSTRQEDTPQHPISLSLIKDQTSLQGFDLANFELYAWGLND
jgi:hypothetical protein